MIQLSRRRTIQLGVASLTASLFQPAGALLARGTDDEVLAHGASPLGDLAYRAGLEHFVHCRNEHLSQHLCGQPQTTTAPCLGHGAFAKPTTGAIATSPRR